LIASFQDFSTDASEKSNDEISGRPAFGPIRWISWFGKGIECLDHSQAHAA